MTSTKIMVIRHAEKPAESGFPTGVLETGEQDPESLTVRGWERAGALLCFFAPTAGGLQYPDIAQPQFLFASGTGKRSDSLRPQQTIKPLSEKLKLSVNTDYSKGEEKDLVAHVLGCSGVVLICWQHEYISNIANEILGETITPQNWPKSRFDLVWVFDLNPISGKYNFKQIPQLLLASDSPMPIT
jgi:broad specificity phosphatase PhoE